MKHFFLSFYSSNNSQNPHSFPTRRSSDLTIPPVAREALLDRHRRVGRLARRLLGPIETEGGDDPRRTPPLDLAPEALDLVEQQLEHAAGLERRLRRGGGDQRRA